MNQTVSAVELKNAASRLLRWRIPLFLALVANIGMVARMAFLPGGAVAAQPMTASTPVADARPSHSTTDAPSIPECEATLDLSSYMPDLTDLAAHWWPAIESAAEAASQLAAAQQPQVAALTIGNLQRNGVAVNFLVDGRVYTLHPGESHMFPVGTSWNLQFHRGGGLGNACESLTPGEYQFTVSSDGWALQTSR